MTNPNSRFFDLLPPIPSSITIGVCYRFFHAATSACLVAMLGSCAMAAAVSVRDTWVYPRLIVSEEWPANAMRSSIGTPAEAS